MITEKTKHLPTIELIELMEQADEPLLYEDMILWRARPFGRSGGD